MPQQTLTRQQALTWLRSNGVAVTDWAKNNGFDPSVVYALLNGRTRGHRGKAHEAALALGLKVRPDPSALTPPISGDTDNG